MRRLRFHLLVGFALCLCLSVSAFAEKYRFVVMGDSRPDFATPLSQPEVFKKILSEVNQLNPPADFVIHTGDGVLGYTKDTAFLEQQFQGFLDTVKVLRAPLFMSPGNHDGFDPVGVRLYQQRIGPLYHVKRVKDAVVISLDDVSQPRSELKFGEKQIQWLEQTLRESAGATHRFVSMHVPVYSESLAAWQEIDSKLQARMMNLFERYKVTAVFQGHVHTYDVSEKNGVKYFVCGGAGAPLYGRDWTDPRLTPEVKATQNKHSYLMVDVDGTRVSYTVRTVDGPSNPGPLVAKSPFTSWESWKPWNDQLALSRQGNALVMRFDAARSNWPMLLWDSAEPLDLSKAAGVSVQVTVSELLGPQSKLRLHLKVGDMQSQSLPLVVGKTQTLKFAFDDKIWRDKAALPVQVRNRISKLGLAVEISEPGHDWWEVTTRSTLRFENVSPF